MDIATLVGVGIAIAAVFVSMIMEGGEPTSILLIPPMIIVLGGTLGVTMATGMMKDFTGSMGAVGRAFTGTPADPESSIATVVEFAETARREGLLALEEAAKSIDDPFLKKGIELAVDGTDPEELREILEAEIRSKRSHDKIASKFFGDMGAFAPTLGIIGTVLGLIHVLENLSNPDELGHLIAGAFVATLWGVLSANAFWLPISKKLARLGDLEAKHMELVLEGVLSVQAGANPRIVEQKLLSFLSPDERPEPTERAA
ncbi:MAG: flagellar motor protein [Actinomycetota bacterium]|nr:flagellar motor protein [Actinomycetota bacterium]